jgi:hypothetical protein
MLGQQLTRLRVGKEGNFWFCFLVGFLGNIGWFLGYISLNKQADAMKM